MRSVGIKSCQFDNGIIRTFVLSVYNSEKLNVLTFSPETSGKVHKEFPF